MKTCHAMGTASAVLEASSPSPCFPHSTSISQSLAISGASQHPQELKVPGGDRLVCQRSEHLRHAGGSSEERGDPSRRGGGRFGHPEGRKSTSHRDKSRDEPRKAKNKGHCRRHLGWRCGEWVRQLWALTSALRSAAFQAAGGIV